ncbi:MAG: hypothetical protein CVU99_08250 [Firmicutes bacterium HGW-Firmicutes-4]|nr:MAG: hypothetical protein CVU99_08250 [Firmicutes bacterium HGW-Firmicutes-4]
MGFSGEGFFNSENEVNAMPRKPKRPCSYPGCKEVTDGRLPSAKLIKVKSSLAPVLLETPPTLSPPSALRGNLPISVPRWSG